MSLMNDHITMSGDSKVLAVGAETSRETAKSLEKWLRATGGDSNGLGGTLPSSPTRNSYSFMVRK